MQAHQTKHTKEEDAKAVERQADTARVDDELCLAQLSNGDKALHSLDGDEQTHGQQEARVGQPAEDLVAHKAVRVRVVGWQLGILRFAL